MVVSMAIAIALPWTSAVNIVTKDPFRDNTLYLYTAGGLAVASLFLMTYDRWFGLFSLYVTFSSIISWSYIGLAIAHWVVLGCFLTIVFSHLSFNQRQWFCDLLVFSAILQIIYATHQLFNYDIFYLGSIKKTFTHVHGTFGYHSYLAIFLSMVAPLAPIVLLPLFLYGLIISKSIVALIGCILGLLVVHRKRLTVRWGALFFVVFIITSYLTVWNRGQWNLATVASRFETWRLGFSEMSNYLIGHGFGSWYVTIPRLQVGKYVGTIELFEQAHNEFVQLFFEGGLIAIVIVVMWLVKNVNVFKGSYGGSLIALIPSTLMLFPFHLAPLALTAIAIMGIALGEQKELKTCVRRSYL